MKRAVFACGLALGLIGAAVALAQGPDYSKMQIRTTRLADNLYVYDVAPSIGNVVSLNGPDGVLLVDAMNEPLHAKLLAAIRATGATGPIRYVINTHLHADHTAANALFAKEGAIILAQDNELKRMMLPKAGAAAMPAELWPSVTYGDQMSIRVDGEDVDLIHSVPAHTDGDTLVFFRHADVLALGDLPSTIRYPFINADDGGGTDGMIAGGKAVLKMIDDKTVLVAGHTGPLVTAKEIAVQDEMLQTVRDRVAKLVAQGKTLQQAIDAKPTAEFDAARVGGNAGPDRFVTMVYTDLAGRKAKVK